MDYQNRSDLEDLTSAYLDALERQDRKALMRLFNNAPTDRIVSIYGYFESVAKTLDEYEEVFSQKGMLSFNIIDSTFEIQHLSDREALLTLFYKVAVLLKGNKSIQPTQVVETLFCIRTDAGWKISYAHQSIQKPLPDSRYQQMQAARLQAMIEMLAKAEDRTVSMPRSLRERLDLFRTLLLEWQGETPDRDYLNLEEEAYEDENNRTTYTLPAALMSDDQQIAAWKESPGDLWRMPTSRSMNPRPLWIPSFPSMPALCCRWIMPSCGKPQNWKTDIWCIPNPAGICPARPFRKCS